MCKLLMKKGVFSEQRITRHPRERRVYGIVLFFYNIKNACLHMLLARIIFEVVA
jgi:hypothetical protein